MLTYGDIVRLHVDKFGVEPVITGVNYWRANKIPELILEAIDNKQPYVEANIDPKVLQHFLTQ
jgi:hypothetical protein